jgi:hypothetical protein
MGRADPPETGPDPAEKIAQGVALLRNMVQRIEDEHGLIGLDALLSCYISMAIEQLGFEKTIDTLVDAQSQIERNCRVRL